VRITFIHTADRLYSENQMFGLHFPPVWAYTLAAHLEGIPDLELKLVDDRVQPLSEAEDSEIFFYSGINQDYRAILANHKTLSSRFPKAIHAIGGPICWSFEKAGRLADLSAFDHCFVGDGEAAVKDFVRDLAEKKSLPKVLERKERFPLGESRPMHHKFLEKSMDRYYGAVIEISRGCPFLCEFCDIRVLPDNNRSHVKNVETILADIDFFAKKGIGQIILACDNFIGNSKWAEELCDAIIEWKKTTGLDPKFYTWLSIDVSRHPNILKKLKASGIDMLFIGVESFHRNSLLETAKLQNTSIDMVEEIRRIQSYGLIVVAGLIFGFDTDPEDIVPITLAGIRNSGLISGDPSLLTALPGTPLYMRMKLSGRLRDGKIGLGGFKYQTNIRYLKPVEKIVEDFSRFVAEFNSGAFQYARLESLYSCLDMSLQESSGAVGFTRAGSAFKMALRNRVAAWLLAKRLAFLFGSLDRLFYIAKAAHLTWRLGGKNRPLWRYFKFWLFNWSNSILKYSQVSRADFDIGSVGDDFDWNHLVPAGYESEFFEPIPAHKIRMQRKNTADSLRRTAQERNAR
jgi:radical SAM superfamily enzyme YgiQ (UPF0313 family)